MPKGPNGEKRPANTTAAAMMIGKIATGEIEDHMPSGRGKAGGEARAKKLDAASRKEIAKKAAQHRWGSRPQKWRVNMTDKTTQEQVARDQNDRVVLMYPSNQLGEQVRGFDETQDVSDLLTRIWVKKSTSRPCIRARPFDLESI